MGSQPSRRQVLLGGAGVMTVAALGGAGAATGVLPVPQPLRRLVQDTGIDGVIPAAPAGRVRLEQRRSQARNRTVGFWTAVPQGQGAGEGLPVCLILHGASATTADYDRFGFARFLTSAVQGGVAPFVLAGADGGVSRWEGDGADDDPRRMLRDELPVWCADRGFDADRLAAYGWSMGGYGSLRFAQGNPGRLRAVAALSPAVGSGDSVRRDVVGLDGRRTGLWCGRSDPFFNAVRELALAIEPAPAVVAFSKGAHQRGYWNRVTPAALAFIGARLA